MESMITGRFKDELKAKRERYNKSFMVAKRAFPQLEQGDLAEFLTSVIEPLINGLDADYGDEISPVTLSLFDISLELVGRKYTKLFNDLLLYWAEFLSFFPKFLVQSPENFPRYIFNALYRINRMNSQSLKDWKETLFQLEPFSSGLDEFMNYGKAAAWRIGLAQYRERAMEILSNVSPYIQRIILRLDSDMSNEDVEEIVQGLISNPWFDPAIELQKTKKEIRAGKELRIVKKISGFRGFDGHFIVPPLVDAEGEYLIAFDDQASVIILHVMLILMLTVFPQCRLFNVPCPQNFH